MSHGAFIDDIFLLQKAFGCEKFTSPILRKLYTTRYKGRTIQTKTDPSTRNLTLGNPHTMGLGLILNILGYIGVVAAVAGVSTFNDFSTQTTVACAGFLPTNSQGTNIFAAAMSDLSPLWIGARCEGSMNAANCNGHGTCINCIGPACPDEEVCGHCFNVKCTGSLDGEVSGACTGKTIKVKIVDACPATHPANYCKIPAFGGTIRPEEACEASGINALDISVTARSQLSTFQGNLDIDIEPTTC